MRIADLPRRPPRRPFGGLTAAVLLASLVAPGCWSVLEPSVPRGPLPRVVPGHALLQVDADVVEQIAQRQVEEHQRVHLARDRHMAQGTAESIQRRFVVTGMTPRQILWVFHAHPTRIRNQGPPGGHTWYWDVGRYWVRFDEQGQVVQAGRY